MVMSAVDAYGYGEVAQHPESIFSGLDDARDFIMPCRGCPIAAPLR
jgi:hypothetical protein